MRGSVQKYAGKRGTSWCYVIDLGRTPEGKRDQKRRRGFPTRKAAEEAMQKELHERRAGTYVEPTHLTVGAYLERWLAEADAGWREATAYAYAGIVRNRIVPYLGDAPLAKLSALDVQACYRRLLEAGYAPSTVRLTHTVLREALEQAVRWRLIPANPCAAAKAPATQAVEPESWTAEEARAFLAATAGDDLARLWRLGLDSGMRLGELLALTWADIDFARGTVAVRRTLTPSRGGAWTIGDGPKSAKGRRSIPLAEATLAALRSHRARQTERRLLLGPDWHDLGLVFDRGNGEPCRPATVQARFERAVARAGVTPLTPHGMRHTMATLLLAAGVHPKIVQERLGHATIGMTLDRYSHVTMDMQRGAAGIMGDLLGEGDAPAAERA